MRQKKKKLLAFTFSFAHILASFYILHLVLLPIYILKLSEQTINEPPILKPYVKWCHFHLYYKCNSSPQKQLFP